MLALDGGIHAQYLSFMSVNDHTGKIFKLFKFPATAPEKCHAGFVSELYLAPWLSTWPYHKVMALSQ